MKRLIALLSLALAAMLALGGIANAAEGKTFRIAMASDPESLDPHMQLSGPILAYSHWVFDPLVRWTPDMKFEARLAEKWEQINPTTMRFHLRKGVKFHSGNPFTAKDVAWTLDRLKKSPDFKGLFIKFAEPKVIDDNTIDIITTEPYGLVMNLATYIFPMDSKFYTGTDAKGQPKDAIVKSGYSFANDNASGTGPYSVAEREQGVKLILKANKGYWGKRGNVDTIELTPIKNEATRVAAILKGDVDFISPVPVQDYDQLSKNADVELITMPSARIITIQLNQKKFPQFADKRVREAIIAATDTAGIVAKVMKGYTTTTQQQAPKGFAGYIADLKPRYNLDNAKKLMKDAGFEKGFEVSMIAPNNRYVNDEKIAQAFVSMMARINIKVNLKTMPKAQYWDQFDAQVADIQMIGWHPDTEDTANYSEYLLMTPNKDTGMGQYNSGNYANPKFDALIDAANRETDPAKRDALLKESEQMAYNDAAFVPLHWEPLSWAARKTVKNAKQVVNAQDFPYFGDLMMQ
ncbi:ABC transporter substrate-binding protein [Nitratidesulfovibrio vulgaris]|uniref:Extracellular solute-binding protein, family 5 n=1 Tax=Nitratidesulfovibrio vulgaris (strain DP4) TaxID=391774 RepID=A0A0H3AAZ0_NITV4|nr:ABC transporter substrate-binding protein [Nitratidesulfovibrio vulgaris]ABM29810.1 extracellular solute-binding protein, family 5 [Nitratidesulfovibrio vulgaris DP4]GEB81097.1 cytochrome c [Desulfovibrio desulfuricans]